MSNDVEYAVRKSIRNNPITREVDRAHARALRRNVWLACLVVDRDLPSAAVDHAAHRPHERVRPDHGESSDQRDHVQP